MKFPCEMERVESARRSREPDGESAVRSLQSGVCSQESGVRSQVSPDS